MIPRHLLPAAFELACLAIFACLVGFQLFVPPIVGVANNSDFRDVLSPLSIGPSTQNLNYFVSDYTIDPKWRGVSGKMTSEIAPVWLSKKISQMVVGPNHFDVRFFGAVNLAMLLGAFSMALVYVRGCKPVTRYVISLLLILIFSGAAYICYMQSFYMDAAAIVFFLLTAAGVFLLADEPANWKRASVFVFAALLLATSKPQHALIAIPAAAASCWLAYRAGSGPSRALLLLGAAGLLASIPLMLHTPSSYRSFASYNVVFLKILRLSPNPEKVLTDFGLPLSDRRLIGTNAFDPVDVLGMKTELFESQVPYQTALRYFFTHPRLLIKTLDNDLRYSTFPVKLGFANYRKEDGFPPWTPARHFNTWSRFRGELNSRFPYNLVLLYGALLVLCCYPVFWRHHLFPVAGFLLLAGCGDFLVTSLGDGMDNVRHLVLFHLITDSVIVLFAGIILTQLQPWIERWRLNRSSRF